MSCMGFFAGHSPIHRLDPRVRLLAATALAIVIALSTRFDVMGWALVCAALCAALARLDAYRLVLRILHLNGFMLFIWLVVPWSVPGETVRTAGGLALSEEGIRLALAITLKGNGIVLLFTALVATIDPLRLPCALKSLRIPDKLVHLFALTVRYTDLIHDEYIRLRLAMRTRAFQARFSAHTLRTFGYLTGLLMVRGMERAERVLAAMKCRGFDGRFHALDGYALRGADVLFAAAALAHAGAWIWMEWR